MALLAHGSFRAMPLTAQLRWAETAEDETLNLRRVCVGMEARLSFEGASNGNPSLKALQWEAQKEPWREPVKKGM